jgi:hypothetical protein
MSECDRAASIMRTTWPAEGCWRHEKSPYIYRLKKYKIPFQTLLSPTLQLEKYVNEQIKFILCVYMWSRRLKKLLDYLTDRRGYSHLKEEALDRTVWRNRFGRGFGLVVRQNTD